MSEATVTDSSAQNAAAAPDVLDTATPKTQLTFGELMPRVASEFSKPLSSQIKDLFRLGLRHHKLSVDEYYQMSLFDDNLYDDAAKRQFIGMDKSREIWRKLMPLSQHIGLANDKLMFERTLTSFGFSTPKTLAVMGGHYPTNSVQQVNDIDSLHAFLESADMPVFAKPIDSLRSLGSVRIEGYSASNKMISVSNGSVVSLDSFMSEIQNKFSGNYLFQSCVERHPAFAKMTGGGLSTIRIATLDSGDGAKPWRAAAKLTSPRTVADNFWRAGNLLAAVDLETGKLGKALTTMGMDGDFVSRHPDTQEPIEGVEIPFWREAIQATQDVASLFPRTLLLGFDVAITPEGPMIIEANADPHLMMMQIAHQEGALDDTMNATLAYADALDKQIRTETLTKLKQERLDQKADMKKALSSKAS